MLQETEETLLKGAPELIRELDMQDESRAFFDSHAYVIYQTLSRGRRGAISWCQMPL